MAPKAMELFKEEEKLWRSKLHNGKRWAWQSGITQLDSEISHLHKYNGDDSFYECIVALFKLPSWKFPNSQIYPCNEKDGKEVMLLLDKCRKELKLNDSC